jgi:hypothetical protein
MASGSPSRDLPGFVVLQSGPRGPRGGASLWSSGFLPTSFQGVPFRGKGDPILHLKSPEGFSRDRERSFYDTVSALNRERLNEVGDPEILTRINAYEMAFRMQTSAPELMETAKESQETLDLYGVKPGESSFAANCLLARRLLERGVRFIQLYHTNWDSHGGPGETLNADFERLCREVDQASAALVLDLKRRGLLDDTLVVWGGEFGRTPMGEVRASIGRDHHIDAYTMWLAGGGVKPGYIHGETDELGFGVQAGKVHVHDLHATILQQLGFDHESLTYRFQGRDYRLTDVHGHVVKEILPDYAQPKAVNAVFRSFLLFVLLAQGMAWAEDGVEFFEKKIRPVLSEHCYECHGPKKQKGGLRMDTPANLRQGGDTGPLFVSKKADESLLITALRYHDKDLRMPPPEDGVDRKLPTRELTILRLDQSGRSSASGKQGRRERSPLGVSAARKSGASIHPVRLGQD